MALRLVKVAGGLAFILVVLRLGRVLQSGPETINWRVVICASAVVGAATAWALAKSRAGVVVDVVVHFVGIGYTLALVSAPTTFRAGFIPTGETIDLALTEVGYGLDVLRFGAPPVLAVAGLVALIAGLGWILGAFWAAVGSSDSPWPAILPAIATYLYLAVVDRADPSFVWAFAFASVAGLGLFATGLKPTVGIGRMRDRSNRALPRHQAVRSFAGLAAVVAVSLVGSGFAHGFIPETGTMAWRSGGGLASGLGGGVSINLFAGLQQNLTERTDEPVFGARLSDSVLEPDEVYWRLVTLGDFDGVNWRPSDLPYRDPGSNGGFGEGALGYRGPSVPVAQAVRIMSLRQEFLPTLATPTTASSSEEPIRSGLQIRGDGSLRVSAPTFDGLTYQVESSVPIDPTPVLAVEDGELTPLFAVAAEEGTFARPEGANGRNQTSPDVSAYQVIHPSITPPITNLAASITAGAATDFERAVLLEAYLRDPERFVYDVSVSTGHSSLDLQEWLTNPQSQNYRRGYCEQFATAMAVMARTLGLASRVVIGFSPGEITPQSDGGEAILVRQRNAHAWVEIWFDQTGWTRFDPTPRSDASNPGVTAGLGFDPGETITAIRPANPDFGPQLPPPNLDDGGFIEDGTVVDGSTSGAIDLPVWIAVLLLAAAAAILVPLAKLLRSVRRRRRIDAGDVALAWRDVVDRLVDVGMGPPRHFTPIEYMNSLDKRLIPFARAYSASTYGGQAVTPDAANHHTRATGWIRSSIPLGRRVLAAFNPASLLARARS